MVSVLKKNSWKNERTYKRWTRMMTGGAMWCHSSIVAATSPNSSDQQKWDRRKQQRHQSCSHDVIFFSFFFYLNKDTILWLIYRNVPPKLTSSVQQDNTSLSPFQTLSFHRIPISQLWTISCNAKLTAYYTADNSKLSTLSGHNSWFLLPKGPKQTTITEDSHS